MPLSIDKCQVVHCGTSNPRHNYQCGGSSLPATASFVDLGVTRSCDGTYHDHVTSVVQKGRKLVGMCLRGLQSRDPAFMLRVYKTYIMPVLNYASSIWSPHMRQEVDELEAVQRRFTKKVTGQAQLSYGARLRNLSLLSLESQRMQADLIAVYKIRHGLAGISLEDAGLSLCVGNTRGGGVRLQQQRPYINSCSLTLHVQGSISMEHTTSRRHRTQQTIII
jgi:hypothetical protein